MSETKTLSKSVRDKREKDFDKMAMVEPELNDDIFKSSSSSEREANNLVGFTMDSTSIIEISRNRNHEYSREIVSDVRDNFDFKELEKSKSTDEAQYLEEAKGQVNDLFSSMVALMTHTELFVVSILVSIGLILNDVEQYLGAKAKYMKWIRENFDHKHMRYFQHAKQLAKMGDFARRTFKILCQ